MIFNDPPIGFAPRFEIVSCFLACGGKILLLRRLSGKSGGGRWGLPGGKLEQGEKLIDGMVREIKEETGIDADSGSLAFLRTAYVRYPEYDFTYHMFRMHLADQPAIRIALQEHEAHCWTDPVAALSLPLVRDLDACIRLMYP